MSRFEWQLAGMLNKWLPTTVSQALANQTKLIKTAEISSGDINNAVRQSLLFDYSKFDLRENDETINDIVAKEALINAFIKLIERDASFRDKIEAYVNANRGFKLSTYFSKDSGKNYLVPTFNGFGESQLKSEFSAYIPYEISPPPLKKTFDYGEVTIKGADDIEDILKMVNAAGFIVANGQMNIGTIRSRKTNWDTSYNLHLGGISASILQELLTWFTDISNNNIRNIVRTERKETFDLTQAIEVHALMARLGLEKVFYDTQKSIKDFEDKKGLKRKHQRFKHIPDYKNNTMISTIDLSQYRDQVFAYLLSKISSNPRYMRMINEAGIRDVQEALDLAFSLGRNGTVITESQVENLMNAAVNQ